MASWVPVQGALAGSYCKHLVGETGWAAPDGAGSPECSGGRVFYVGRVSLGRPISSVQTDGPVSGAVEH